MQDAGSTTCGTWYNNRYIHSGEEVTLQPGDVIGLNTDGNETTQEITFRVEDLTTYGVLGADGTEFMAAISGYGLDIAFNLKLINSLADAEAMADAMADVFYEALMAQLIDRKRIQVKPAGAQDPILG